MSWTVEQQYTIDSRNESLLVSAAAGSGKTSVLVERVVKLLEGGADLSRMLVVTFTNAAASEMKERIAKVIGPSALINSHISTFHSFAIEILKRYYYTIGVNPSLKVCDEYKQSILKKEALDELFEELFEKDDENFIRFLNCYADAKSSEKAGNMVLALSSFLESLPYPEDFLDCLCNQHGRENAFFESGIDSLLHELEKILNQNNVFLKILLDPSKYDAKPLPGLAAKVSEDSDSICAVMKMLSEGRSEDGLKLLADLKLNQMRCSKAESVIYEPLKESIGPIRKAANDAFRKLKAEYAGFSKEKLSAEIDAMSPALNELVFLTKEFNKRYAKKKEKDKLIDFSDIEHFALKVLDDESVCEEIRNDFDYIFVDEYQDSNLVQDELINRIAKEDNVFLVGDVKQSIYKFRLAEPELFIKRYKEYKGGSKDNAKAVDLNANFRSKKPVIDFINDIFVNLMTKKSVGMDYDEDAQLKEGKIYTGDKLFAPRLYLVRDDEDDSVDPQIREMKASEQEALAAVKIINEYKGKIIYDGKADCERPLQYRDMVILMRSVKNRGEIFYKALQEAGIPVYLERGEGYFDTPEIEVFMNLLRILDNFRQDIPLISVMHFPGFDFSSSELAAIRIFANESGLGKTAFHEALKYYAGKGNDNSLKEKINEFMQRLQAWRMKQEAMPLGDFLWLLLSESGILDFASALSLGIQRSANLRALADKAESYENQNAGGLYGFIRYIEAITEGGGGVDTGQVSVLSEGCDAVRIMTIHKSKGLEFPFVLLSGLAGRFRSSKSDSHLCFHKDLGGAIRIAEPKKGLYTDPMMLGITEAKKAYEEYAETIRVLYVAMTRAKDILLMSAAGKLDEKNCFLSMIKPYIDENKIEYLSLSDLEKYKSKNETDFSMKRLCIYEGFAVDESKLELSASEIRKRLEFDYSPDPESLLKTKYSVSDIARLKRMKSESEKPFDESQFYAKPAFLSDEPLGAASKGTAYHKVMEHIPFDERYQDTESVRALIKELCSKNILSDKEYECIDPDRIANFFKSDIGKRAAKANDLKREYPFVLKTLFEEREVLVQGTIDCCFTEDNEFVLVDYKSNYVDKSELESEMERLKEEYIPQLELYKEALEQICGRKVKEAVLYLFSTNDVIRIC